uniref:WAP domain-containing protein n=1 Tax=Leptobrachium leishanense TaxID=445787 RepID=A0A8C5QS11_9ANUR
MYSRGDTRRSVSAAFQGDAPKKSGVCPPTTVKCAPLPLKGRCRTDAQCVGNKKCCQVKCTMECVDPI